MCTSLNKSENGFNNEKVGKKSKNRVIYRFVQILRANIKRNIVSIFEMKFSKMVL